MASKPNRKHPEQQYGFWKSCVGDTLGVAIYMSPLVWILPVHEDVACLLLNYEIFQDGIPDLHEAVLLEVKNLFPIVYHHHRAVHYPLDLITNAQRCAKTIELARYNATQGIWDSYNDHVPGIASVVLDTDITNVLLSKNGDLLVATDALAQYIVFKNGLTDVSREIVHLMLKDVAVLSSLVGEN